MFLILRKVWIKCWNWEYWPVYVVNAPVLFIYLWFALRARSFLFFANVNPAIPTGGLFGESKKDIHDLLPEHSYPKTFFVETDQDVQTILVWMDTLNVVFPIICKPDVGERGYRVELVEHEKQLVDYIASAKHPFLVQEYIDYPVELSVVAYSYPDGVKSGVSSICYKKPLTVEGNGISTLRDLIIEKPRALLQLDRLKNKWGGRFDEVIEDGEAIELEGIGNHSRGSMFLDWNDRNNVTISDRFVSLIKGMDGVHFGRFDIKCKSESDFLKGTGFKILEFNGVGGEPAHVYDPKHSFFNMIKVSYSHWKIIFEIGKMQKNFKKIPTLGEGVKLYKAYTRKISS